MIAQSARFLVSMTIFTAFMLVVFLFSPQLAFAQKAPAAAPAPAPAKAGANKKTTVNFEDQLIEGQTAKPELFYLLQQRSPNFKRLIKLRENFIPEMQDTAEDMNRSGSGH